MRTFRTEKHGNLFKHNLVHMIPTFDAVVEEKKVLTDLKYPVKWIVVTPAYAVEHQ